MIKFARVRLYVFHYCSARSRWLLWVLHLKTVSTSQPPAMWCLTNHFNDIGCVRQSCSLNWQDERMKRRWGCTVPEPMGANILHTLLVRAFRRECLCINQPEYTRPGKSIAPSETSFTSSCLGHEHLSVLSAFRPRQARQQRSSGWV